MSKEIKIPQISEGVDTATVAEILVAEGDTVEKDQSLITVESDKASVEIPSTAAGKIESIKISEGDEVNVGDVIMTVQANDDSDDEDENDKDKDADASTDSESKNEDDENGEEKDDSQKKKKKSSKEKKEDKEGAEEADKEDQDQDSDNDDDVTEEEKKEEEDDDDDDSSEEESDESDEADKKSEKKATKNDQPVPASPGVRKLARELGVDLKNVEGSGHGGRISDADVKAASKAGKKSQAISENLPDFSQWGDTETKPLSGIRKTTGKKVTQAWQEIPHVFQFNEADITDIQKYMDQNKEKAEKAGGKMTITAILTKIIGDALQRFPKFNASLDLENDQIILKKYINIGIAVNTEKGLLMPVIKNVDKKGIIDLAVELSELAKKARDGKLKGEEMKGGNFSISNLGGIGGTNFTPIIYAPQSAILGVSHAQIKPVYREDQLEPREILPLSLSYDHRLIDGAEAAEFITWLKLALEDPFKALLG